MAKVLSQSVNNPRFFPLEVDVPRPIAPLYCRCSCGWLKEIFETALGKRVVVELQASIKQGADSCRFRVCL